MLRSFLKSSALIASIFFTQIAQAACNNPSNWLETPKEGVKAFIGYQQELPRKFASAPDNGLEQDHYPPPLPQDMLSKEWKYKPSENKEKEYISYYEPDGHGQWRICRKEEWHPLESPPSQLQELTMDFLKNGNNSEYNKKLSRNNFLISSSIYLYDDVRRLKENFETIVKKNSNGILYVKKFNYQCFYYNNKNLITQYVRTESEDVCPTGEPDPYNLFIKFRYAEIKDEKGQPATIQTWRQYHYEGVKKKPWGERINFKTPVAGLDEPAEGEAKVKEGLGIVEIIGGFNFGVKDQSVFTRHMLQDGSLPAENYEFPFPPVPTDILSQPDLLYNYDRRRMTQIDNIIQLVEYYPPHVHQIRQRFYTLLGRNIRQEQYDDEGKLRRVINLGFVGLNTKNGGFYDEDLSSVSIKLKPYRLHYRVWEYDDAGNTKLVAIGWDSKFGSGFRKHPDPLDEAKMSYGTPDGKKRWKDEEAFFKAFGFDRYASAAYPERKKAN